MLRLLTCVLLVLSAFSTSLLAQTDPLPGPQFHITIDEFRAKAADPNVNSSELMKDWYGIDGISDAASSQAITFLANRDAAELQAMADAIKSLAASQTRMAQAMEDMVSFELLKQYPSPTPAPLPINVNTASPLTLMQIHGIGPKLAGLIASIASTTPFGSVNDLILVPGMTQSLLDQVSPFLQAP